MISRTILMVLVCLSATQMVCGQTYEQPGPEHEYLKKYEGSWEAVFDINGQKFPTTATYKRICGGMWVASDLEGTLFGAPYSGHGLDGYDQRKQKYVGIWVQSVSSAPMHYEGTLDDQGVLTMTGTSHSPEGTPEKYKNTTQWKDDDHFTFKMFMVDEAGKDQLAFTIEYTRRR